MSHNPYAPPTAAVSDPPMPEPGERPRIVTLAVRLLWLSIVMGIPGAIYEVFFKATQELSRGEMIVVAAIVYAITLFIAWWLFRCAAKGRHWARVTLTILLGIGVLGSYVALPLMFAESTYDGVMYILQYLVSIAAIVLLFTPAANEWFRRRD